MSADGFRKEGGRLRSRLIVSAALALGAGAAAAPAETIDAIISSALGDYAPGAVVNERGSTSFRRGAEALKAGHWEEAYALARGISNPVERRAIQWAAIQNGDGAIDYRTVARFEADAPHFAPASLYRTRLEQALTDAVPDKDEIIRVLGGHLPMTLDAQIALAGAYVLDGQRERAGRIIAQLWASNVLDRAREDTVLARFGSLIDRDTHWQRSVMLLMHERASGTERIMRYLSPAQVSLANAAIAVMRETSNAARLVDQVDPHYRDHPLFWWIRAQYAFHHDNMPRAAAMLGEAAGPLPEAAEWWYFRRKIARQALAERDYRTAYRAAAGYTEGPEGRVVDANFHAGWIALRFLDDPQTAITHFTNQTRLSTLPTSITQANYWLGRAYEAAGNAAAARQAYAVAAEYSGQYYGQLARAKLGIDRVDIRSLPAWQSAELAFDARETVQAVRLMAGNGLAGLAEPLVMTIAYSITEVGEYPLAARLAQSIGAHHVAIRIAELAEQRGVAMDLFAFPKDGLPASYRIADIDRAAVYAVARQESRFDRNAVSSSGARGLMQLMPATARETAGKLGVSYSASRLTADPAYNALLGSTYLAAQLDRFGNSLVLAAAAYNAGGGNVSKWIAIFGDPRQGRVDPVDWIEMIPFNETRDYVKKVLGNYQVYRARLGDDRIGIEGFLRGI